MRITRIPAASLTHHEAGKVSYTQWNIPEDDGYVIGLFTEKGKRTLAFYGDIYILQQSHRKYGIVAQLVLDSIPMGKVETQQAAAIISLDFIKFFNKHYKENRT